MFFADVIMPFTAIYFAWCWFFPINILALASEIVVFKIAYRSFPDLPVIRYTLGANAASFFFGGLVASLVEVAIYRHKGTFWSGSDPTYPYYLWLGVLFALVLSIYIELRVWQWLSKKRPVSSLDRACALANLVSYGIIVGAALLLFGH
jgi:hypothetical protein